MMPDIGGMVEFLAEAAAGGALAVLGGLVGLVLVWQFAAPLWAVGAGAVVGGALGVAAVRTVLK
jgi:hypothetical protein